MDTSLAAASAAIGDSQLPPGYEDSQVLSQQMSATIQYTVQDSQPELALVNKEPQSVS